MVNKSALGIFFRIPIYGKVKKRLAAEIGEEAALNAYTSMLNVTIDNVSRLQDTDIFGFYEGEILFLNHPLPSDNPPIPPLEKGGEGGFDKGGNFELLKKLPLIPQKGENLGGRMFNAMKCLFEKGYERVLLIGVDSPDLPLSFIIDAFKKLEFYDLVIGPSEDGGYYLIGITKPIKNLFTNIHWGSSNVLNETISRAEDSRISYFLLPGWYDIDNLNNLLRWKRK